MPNDDRELYRLQRMHTVWSSAIPALHLSPLPEQHDIILDLGTGSGNWAIEIADKYPRSKVVGRDLSPVMPLEVPVNLHFELDDFLDFWTDDSNTFDLIHGRYLLGGFICGKDIFYEAFRALKPGGYIEIHDFEFNPEYACDTKRGEWITTVKSCLKARNILCTTSEEYIAAIRGAGFGNVQVRTFEPFDAAFEPLHWGGVDAFSSRLYSSSPVGPLVQEVYEEAIMDSWADESRYWKR
jgi:SAM-dependent methyltransferase